MDSNNIALTSLIVTPALARLRHLDQSAYSHQIGSDQIYGDNNRLSQHYGDEYSAYYGGFYAYHGGPNLILGKGSAGKPPPPSIPASKAARFHMELYERRKYLTPGGSLGINKEKQRGCAHRWRSRDTLKC